MRQDVDRTSDSISDRTMRLTVHEAAGAMGISAEAVRQRIKRGTLETKKDPNGTVRVLLDADRTRNDARTDGDRTTDRTADQALITAHLDHLEQEVAFLRAELQRREQDHREESRRKDHLLAAALERVPQLEAPASPAPRESPETVVEDAEGSEHRPATGGVQDGSERRSSWWRRFFGF